MRLVTLGATPLHVLAGEGLMPSVRYSIWPVLFTRDSATGKLEARDDPSIWTWLKPTGHIFYETRLFDVNDGLPKWEGYEHKSRQMA